MSHKRFWVAASIIAVIVVVGFVLSVPHTHEVAQTASSQKKPATVPTVSLHDSFRKGVHTITGSLEMPNACTITTADAVVSGNASSTQKILIQISQPADVGICLQVPTPANFSVTASAPIHVPISATVNGVDASTTIL